MPGRIGATGSARHDNCRVRNFSHIPACDQAARCPFVQPRQKSAAQNCGMEFIQTAIISDDRVAAFGGLAVSYASALAVVANSSESVSMAPPSPSAPRFLVG